MAQAPSIPSRGTSPKDTITSLRAELNKAKEVHAKDIATIGKELAEAAYEHELCDEFFDVVRDLNKKLTTKLEVERKGEEGDVSFTVRIHAEDVRLTKMSWGGTETTGEYDAALEKTVKDALTKAGLRVLYVEDIEFDG